MNTTKSILLIANAVLLLATTVSCDRGSAPDAPAAAPDAPPAAAPDVATAAKPALTSELKV